MTDQNRRIRCFVAMAFGRNDCDLLYKNQIYPTLSRILKLEVIRVDRRQHKDDLNNFIIRMLKSSDIVVADLTYARPSVYYEAGFAERQIPVVYTARQDHLNRSQVNEWERVHFDLEMKKIIKWATPQDRTFSNRLAKRVNYFLSPLRRQIKKDKKIERDRQAFAALSVADRCAEITSKFTAKLHEKRFYTTFVTKRDVVSYDYYWYNTAARHTDLLSGFYGIKLVGNVCFSSFIIAAESVTKKQIEEVVNLFSATNLVSHQELDGIKQFRDYYFICALRTMPISRLTSAFPHAKPSIIPGRYTLQKISIINRIDTQITIDLISPIESLTEALAAAKRAAEELPREKTNRYTCFGRSSRSERPHIWFRRHKFYEVY